MAAKARFSSTPQPRQQMLNKRKINIPFFLAFPKSFALLLNFHLLVFVA